MAGRVFLRVKMGEAPEAKAATRKRTAAQFHFVSFRVCFVVFISHASNVSGFVDVFCSVAHVFHCTGVFLCFQQDINGTPPGQEQEQKQQQDTESEDIPTRKHSSNVRSLSGFHHQFLISVSPCTCLPCLLTSLFLSVFISSSLSPSPNEHNERT